MLKMRLRLGGLALVACWLAVSSVEVVAQALPVELQARILQREDERNLNGRELTDLLQSPAPAIRERVALALGRIGDRAATPELLAALERERIDAVRRMIVFGLGEMEDPRVVEPLLRIVTTGTHSAALRARAAEALGKLPAPPDRSAITRQLIPLLPAATAILTSEQAQQAGLVVTALLRLRAPEAVAPLAALLGSTRAEVRAAAANALARSRQPLTQVVDQLLATLADPDPEVRANVARALGVARDPRAAIPLTDLLRDGDERVVVAAIRALGALPESRPATVAPLLIDFGQAALAGQAGQAKVDARSPRLNLLFELATVLGALRDPRAVPFLTGLRQLVGIGASPEVETALAGFGAESFLTPPAGGPIGALVEGARRSGGGAVGNLARGLAVIGDERSRELLLWLWGSEPPRAISRPELLRALAKVKPLLLPTIIAEALRQADPVLRGVAAELTAGLEPTTAHQLLVDTWRRARNDQANDGQLAILRALAQDMDPAATAVLREAAAHPDHLVRRLAIETLRNRGAGDLTSATGIVRTSHSIDYYRRLARQLDRPVTLQLATTRGSIELELFPREAPLTVDNLRDLATKGYFSGTTFHRVVPNFVIQGGDPRGDGEGGPGHQIRCEINTRPYLRGTLGMALSGKDTGGSQFFITHSAQPHLDGGYTVFGQVSGGMEVVDRITRGDLILGMKIVDDARQTERRRRHRK